MVKKIFPILIFGVIVATIGFAAPLVSADVDTNRTDMIRANCHAAQSTMQTVSRNETVVRINRGRAYDQILKLMHTFNARLAANNKSAPKLDEITADFEKEINKFRSSYNDYEDSINGAIKTNCASQPVAFYEGLVEARLRRSVLNARIKAMDGLLDHYYTVLEQVLPSGDNQ